MILTGSQKSLTNRKYTFPSESIRVQWYGRTIHHYTSGFPMESKGIRLDSSRQYWTTLITTGATQL